mmetsp:Transcript_19650/g.58284  ORF Transcript_19650/g.58284 Transcript_19650/m.58284 type:complete len:201 (-) Transcript_19650:1463-2065(-)
MSNMRSASSSTRYVTRRRLVILPLAVVSRSIMRPGVHTMISVPRFRSEIWLATPEPPNTGTHVRPSGLPNFLISFAICCTSSRVGASTSATGPSPSASGGWSLTCRIIGNTNPSVLPEPVFAMPMQSRPLMMMGKACAWIASGLSQPLFLSTSSSLPLRPHCVHARIGLGTFLPRTLMPSTFITSASSASSMRASSGTSM